MRFSHACAVQRRHRRSRPAGGRGRQQRSEHGTQAGLGSHDRDSLDLLRMLMQQVQQQQRPDPVPAALARLQVPLARAAMADPGRARTPRANCSTRLPKSRPLAGRR